ncbi:MAG: phosphoenolpyruvate--protein phosphotransferase [Alphaproteobacteria bacterium]|nr:MAG: phosphoenolpyruvate--protein phosphotransferase [Alphaproteobacteria bacterium]
MTAAPPRQDAAAARARPERVLTGVPVAPGIAVGVAWLSAPGELSVPECPIAPDLVEGELQRFAEALALAQKQLRKLKTKAAQHPAAAAEELQVLLDARLQMLAGGRLVRGIEARIRDHLVNAEAAVRAEVGAIADSFAKMGDSYLAQRAADVREVGDRLVRALLRTPYQALQHMPAGSVLIAWDLTPSDTALLDPSRVGGLATAIGSRDSHTAIIARSLSLPAVVAVAEIVEVVEPGDLVIVDGTEGRVVINPTPETADLYAKRADDMARERLRLARIAKLPAVTRDGVAITLSANLELARDIPAALAAGAAGVGLLRTEMPVLNADALPDEDEQTRTLSEIVAGMNGRPVTIRTLDIGGDKLSAKLRRHLARELGSNENPALGVRGIRLGLARPEVLDTQLAAILRAGAHGSVRILLPMITSVTEVRAVRERLDRVARRLRRRGLAIANPLPPVGVMIEVPGAALAADALAMESDFFAIGTNDLTMYTLAIDRGNDGVAALYNPLHPAVLRLIQFTIQAGLRARRPVSVCGEIAGDPRYTSLLVGLGVHDLSMAPPSLPRVKERVRNLSARDAALRARQVMEEWDETAIAALLDSVD